ncbi:hypothetical protein ANN_04789 [Periplaneta americana]|uniref:Uncharacterized protein n=1 Tax=Periplaneta americana TaxID=6978 RepID=A0ABQ8T9G4_PERAM|nr:hypothetical protein ANN_04789 [Periplaneta americana]
MITSAARQQRVCRQIRRSARYSIRECAEAMSSMLECRRSIFPVIATISYHRRHHYFSNFSHIRYHRRRYYFYNFRHFCHICYRLYYISNFYHIRYHRRYYYFSNLRHIRYRRY